MAQTPRRPLHAVLGGDSVWLPYGGTATKFITVYELLVTTQLASDPDAIRRYPCARICLVQGHRRGRSCEGWIGSGEWQRRRKDGHRW